MPPSRAANAAFGSIRAACRAAAAITWSGCRFLCPSIGMSGPREACGAAAARPGRLRRDARWGVTWPLLASAAEMERRRRNWSLHRKMNRGIQHEYQSKTKCRFKFFVLVVCRNRSKFDSFYSLPDEMHHMGALRAPLHSSIRIQQGTALANASTSFFRVKRSLGVLRHSSPAAVGPTPAGWRCVAWRRPLVAHLELATSGQNFD